jgi:hypothetical protein
MKIDAKERLKRRTERQRKYKREHPEIIKKQKHRYNARHPEVNRKAVKKYKKNNPEKKRAGDFAQFHVPLGELCEICGAEATCRHHPDYSKPLLVMRLCSQCHKDVHKKVSKP